MSSCPSEYTLSASKEERYTIKATGITRWVDALGRIVIPKEIRRTLKIREGDPSHTTFTSEERFVRAVTNICKIKVCANKKGGVDYHAAFEVVALV